MSKKSRSQRKKNKNRLSKQSNLLVQIDSRIKTLLDEKKFSEIIALLEPKAEQENLTDFQLSSLAYSIIEEKYKDGSEQALKLISKIKVFSNNDLLVKGRCFVYQSQWDEAVSLLENLYTDDHNPTTLYYLCLALLKDRSVSELFGKKYYWSEVDNNLKDEETIADLENLLDAGVKKNTVYLAFFYWLDALWFYKNQEKPYEDKRNIILLNRALEIFPDDENLRLKLARRYEQAGEVENAENTLRWAFTSEAPSGKIFSDSIDFLVEIGKLDEALQFFDKACELNLFNSQASISLRVKLLYKIGKIKEANLIIDNICNSAELPKHKFGLLIQKTFYEFSKDNFSESIKTLCEATIIWDEIAKRGRAFDYIYTPDISFDYVDSYGSERSYYVLQSAEIDSILNSAVINLIPYLNSLEEYYCEAVLKFITNSYDRYGLTSEQISELNELLKIAVERNLYSGDILKKLSQGYLDLEYYKDYIEVQYQYYVSLIKHNREFDVEFSLTYYTPEGEATGIEEKIDKKTAVKIHKILLKKLNIASAEEKKNLVIPLYNEFWSHLLKHHEMFSELVNTAEILLTDFPDDTNLLWKHAFYSKKIGLSVPAARSYRHLLSVEPEHVSSLHNLALIVSEFGNLDEAVELSNKAFALAPDDEIISTGNKNLNNSLQEFKKTITKWNKLDFYKRKILFILENTPHRPSNSYIAKELGYNVDVKAIGGHLRRLSENDWITEDKPKYILNRFVSKILPLCDNQFLVGGNNSSQILTGEQNNQGSVVPIKTSIVRLEDRQAIKPIFNSNGEFHWYQEFISFFPNYHVMPNTSLQTIFKYDTMKTLLNPDDFSYYLMASVDICVISTEDFLPKFGFELDSHFHDEVSRTRILSH